MSFGYGVGDVIVVATLAWNVYKLCKDSPGVYKTISSEALSLHVILKETDDLIAEETAHDAASLNQISMGCKEVLQDLQGLLKKYNSLGTQAQRTWDRMQFGMEDIAAIRSRLIAHTGMLTAFNAAVTRSSQKRMEKKLEKFMAEVRAGLREGSVVSTHTAHTVEHMDEDELWQGLRRELEDVGISPQILSEKKDSIVAWIKTAIADGTLEEVADNDDDDPQLATPTLSPQQNRARGCASSSGAVSPGLSTTTPSKQLLSTWRFLNKILQDAKKFLAAAEAGNIDIVMEQLKYGTDVEVKDKSGWTALLLAAKYGHEKVVKVLLDSGAEKEAKTNMGGSPALHLAAEYGHEKVVKVLLDGGAEKEAKQKDGWTALHLAAESGHEKVVKVLLDGGAEKEAKTEFDSTAQHLAAYFGFENVVKFLWDIRAKNETRYASGSTALHFAAANAHEKVVKVLLDGGAEKEAKQKDGWTALHLAAKYGHEKVVKVLLDGGVEKEARDMLGSTALHFAAEYGHEKVVKVLLDSGAEKEAKQKDGQTALHFAAESGHEMVVKVLLGRGAEKNAQDPYGWTALHLAAYYGRETVVKALLDSGSKKEVRDNKGRTAHGLAVLAGKATIVKLLE